MISQRTSSMPLPLLGFSFLWCETGKKPNRLCAGRGRVFWAFFLPLPSSFFCSPWWWFFFLKRPLPFLGEKSGFLGYFIASVVGAVTLIPGFVALPMAKLLLEHGAGVAQMAVFISTLMMVGVVTAPLEARYFRFRATLWRNLLAYFYSFLVGYAVWIAFFLVRR